MGLMRSCANAVDAWRERQEELAQLEACKPLDMTGHAEEAWNMSLRNAWERYVPVGHTFSGLWAAVSDKRLQGHSK
jgi:hypothetical protein